jgi:predicted nucleic-acid-binding protein
MIGLDSNVLIRYFVEDDPIQSRRATEFLERHLTMDEPGFVSLATMAETVWVLERSYRLDRDAIVAIIERMLGNDFLVVQSEREVFCAMREVRAGRGSFGDALIAALGAEAGCTHTVTFDRGALRLDGFVAL